MGCHSYCRKCDAPLAAPTIKEALGVETRVCGSCGHDVDIDPSDRNEAISNLIDRLESLEAQVVKNRG